MKLNQLREKEEIFHAQEDEIVYLRRELEKALNEINTSLIFDKIPSMLDDILRSQRSPSNKTGLGYVDEQNIGETSGCYKVNLQNQDKSYVMYLNFKD